MTHGSRVCLRSEPERTGDVYATAFDATQDPPAVIAHVAWDDGRVSIVRADDLRHLDPVWLGGLGDGPFQVVKGDGR
jgi:hypothetical protein